MKIHVFLNSHPSPFSGFQLRFHHMQPTLIGYYPHCSFNNSNWWRHNRVTYRTFNILVQWRRNEFESRGHWSGAKRLLNFVLVVPLHFFGSKSTISRFGERFRDGQYSLVNFLFAVLLLTVPPVPSQPFAKVGGHARPVPYGVGALFWCFFYYHVWWKESNFIDGFSIQFNEISAVAREVARNFMGEGVNMGAAKRVVEGHERGGEENFFWIFGLKRCALVQN